MRCVLFVAHQHMPETWIARQFSVERQRRAAWIAEHGCDTSRDKRLTRKCAACNAPQSDIPLSSNGGWCARVFAFGRYQCHGDSSPVGPGTNLRARSAVPPCFPAEAG